MSSDVGLNNASSEDTNGVWIDPATNEVYLTTVGSFNVAGLSGDGADIFICIPGSLGTNTNCTFNSYWDGSLNGFAGEVVDAVDIVKSGATTQAIPSSSPTATFTPLPPTATNTSQPSTGSDVIYLSSTSNGNTGGVSFNDEDILAYDTASDTWSMFFDGSDVGVTGDVNAFALMPDGSLLLSLTAPTSLSGVGSLDDSDIVRFTPTSLGVNTAGSFSSYFVGADAGLTTSGEDIDAIDFTPDGRLIVSTVGSYSVPGLSGKDEDLIVLDSSGTSWSLYFDGSDVGLDNASSEDTNGVWIYPGTNEVYLTTAGSFNVTGLSGDGADIFICVPGSLGTTTDCTFNAYWDGSLNGFAGEVIDGVDIVR